MYFEGSDESSSPLTEVVGYLFRWSLLVLEKQTNNFLTLGRETIGMHAEQKVPCSLYGRLAKGREVLVHEAPRQLPWNLRGNG